MSLLQKLPEQRHLLHVRLSVTLYRKTGTATYASGVTINNVWREDITVDQVPPFLANKQSYFNLYRTLLNAVGYTQTPKPGDVIEAESTRYTVDNVEHLERDSGGVQRYRCLGTRE